jgi:hypothetical protein
LLLHKRVPPQQQQQQQPVMLPLTLQASATTGWVEVGQQTLKLQLKPKVGRDAIGGGV